MIKPLTYTYLTSSLPQTSEHTAKIRDPIFAVSLAVGNGVAGDVRSVGIELLMGYDGVNPIWVTYHTTYNLSFPFSQGFVPPFRYQSIITGGLSGFQGVRVDRSTIGNAVIWMGVTEYYLSFNRVSLSSASLMDRLT